MKGQITIAVISLLLGACIVWFIKPCKVINQPEIIRTDTVIVDQIIRDTIYQEIPVPVKITEIKHDTTFIPADVDTTAILADYYSVREYADTLLDNKDIYVHLTEKVSKNALFDRIMVYESRCRDLVITNTVFRNGFYYGGSLDYKTNLNIYLNLAYQKDKYIYIGGFSPLNRGITLGVLRKF